MRARGFLLFLLAVLAGAWSLRIEGVRAAPDDSSAKGEKKEDDINPAKNEKRDLDNKKEEEKPGADDKKAPFRMTCSTRNSNQGTQLRIGRNGPNAFPLPAD